MVNEVISKDVVRCGSNFVRLRFGLGRRCGFRLRRFT